MSKKNGQRKNIAVRLEAAKKPEKTARQEKSPDKFISMNLAWKMSVIDLNGPWGWSEVSGRELLIITKRLKELEVMNLSEIEATGSHEIPKDKICGAAQARLAQIHQDDTDLLFSIRVMKRKRAWGIRDGNVVKLIWWDPDHTVYPMNIANN